MVQSEAEISTITTSKRLCVMDKNSGFNFLVDTGANISVIPATKKPYCSYKCSEYRLYAANGTEIKTYGVKTLILDLNLRRPYRWSFIIADVNQPILGADFLSHHKLVVDVYRKKLIDEVTNLSVITSVKLDGQGTITTINSNHPYSDLLALYPDITKPMCFKDTPRHSVVHYIETNGPPVSARPRPLPPDKFEKVKAEFQRMQDMGICRPSKSSWSSPLHVVVKKNGELRPCGDYRRLNYITKPDRYPIPHIQHCSYLLANKKIYTRLDLQRAYHNIGIAEQDIEKTAITTPFGLYEFPRMTFGLRNAAQTFQRFLNNEVFQNLNFLFSYIDDVIIASSSEIEHQEHLKIVFERLNKFGLTINLAKCEFGKTELDFLGFHISEKGLGPLEDRVKVLSEFPRPQTIDELRRFLGMINFYRRLLPGAAGDQAKLNIYLRNTKKRDKSLIQWTPETKEAFEQCKQSLKNAVTLSFPIAGAPISIMTDCSNTCAGAVLQQKEGTSWKPLGFFSNKLSEAQQRYSTFDRELLAIYMAIKYFRYLIEGRPVTIYTDHKPLVQAFKKNSFGNNDTPRRLRHLDYVMQFCTKIEHIKGSENTVADALSRIATIDFSSTINYEDLAKSQSNDTELLDLLKSKTLNIKKVKIPNCNAYIYCETSHGKVRPYLPLEFRASAYNAIHGVSHPGIRTTRNMMRERYFWKSMNKHIASWTRSCLECQRSKVQRHNVSPFKSFEKSDRFEHIHIDIVGPLKYCNGYRYLLTMLDRSTGWPEAYPLKDITAESVAETVYYGWIARFGCPLRITTDQGRQFESNLFNQLARRMGITRIRTTAYHPQANGAVERWHRSLKTSLMCRGNTENWVKELPSVLLGLRASYRDDTQISAAELVYGETIRLPGDFFELKKPEISSEESFLQALRQKIRDISSVPRRQLRQKEIFVHPELEKCSHVFVRCDRISSSLTPPYSGPYKILSRTDKYFKIQEGDTQKNISIDRLKPAFMLYFDDNARSPNMERCNINKSPIVTRSGRISKPTVRFTL